MTTHTALIEWQLEGGIFTDNRYSRAHTWRFDGGLSVPASSSPHLVRVPLSNPDNLDPEEAYVAALASCHMLWFLSLAAIDGYRVERYRDQAQGVMESNDAGALWVARVLLRPHVVFSGAQEPNGEANAALHHAAHTECFLANSVKSAIQIEGTWEYAP
jgi:organic hydroperoxide reductase OsmC/OhrA